MAPGVIGQAKDEIVATWPRTPGRWGGTLNTRDPLADFGLVSMVLGGAVTLLLGMVTIGVGALLGRIPLVLGLLLGLAVLVSMIGLFVTITTARNRGSDRPADLRRDGDP